MNAEKYICIRQRDKGTLIVLYGSQCGVSFPLGIFFHVWGCNKKFSTKIIRLKKLSCRNRHNLIFLLQTLYYNIHDILHEDLIITILFSNHLKICNACRKQNYVFVTINLSLVSFVLYFYNEDFYLFRHLVLLSKSRACFVIIIRNFLSFFDICEYMQYNN